MKKSYLKCPKTGRRIVTVLRSIGGMGIYNSRKDAMRERLRQYGADQIIILQNDLAGAFFQNNQNMTFGFYFNGAVRFVCPYENFISSTITNSGVEMEYKNKLSLGGVFDGGGLSGMIVGRESQPYLRKPTKYELQISYFDKDGKVSSTILPPTLIRVSFSFIH